jgi:16S rRNA processing protein RimM
MRVLRVRVHHHTPVLELEGITTPEQARGYLHWDIVVHREAGAAKGRDEYYVSDLVGCDVVVDSQPAGRVISVIEAPQADLLEIELPDAGSPASNASGSESRRVLLPFMQVYVGAVDPEAGRIEVLERWLLD